MQIKLLTSIAALLSIASAAYVPSEPWSILTPDSPAPSGATTDYTKTFGIAIQQIATNSVSSSLSASTAVGKRDVISQIGDGQIQATTSTAQVVSQIGDGQIQATTSTAQVVSQIGDGQIQATTSTAQVVSQIGDGQIQATTSTAQVVSQIGDGQIQATTVTPQVISQIGDGQIQATTSTAQVVSQIGDGQIQATTSTAQVVSQIGDGQIQATTESAVSQITDGQVQATISTNAGASQVSDGQVQDSETSSSLSDSGLKNIPVSCLTESSLALTLNEGILTDVKGRIGSIVANRQFQFDGPPPQAGAIFAAGWSITEDGLLAIGDNDQFYQCLSGTFYNLYDESIGSQCIPVHLEIVDLITC
ncbi:hypothetical protein WICMUC_003581 [Wickerhamomyces mucosus]|uniref:Cell wall mannoprotein PIR1-like C-terminal domain-containing protein n=1 Tax=Wickerhamomyces mucosus TaxID=1378264 RepID=A0A9P8PJY7_9ASCO|nr:hypothetical protein WICMUC_003581 [Wickerhamomyces mucosus]